MRDDIRHDSVSAMDFLYGRRFQKLALEKLTLEKLTAH